MFRYASAQRVLYARRGLKTPFLFSRKFDTPSNDNKKEVFKVFLRMKMRHDEELEKISKKMDEIKASNKSAVKEL